jgi:DUF177 domain-containing protein
MAGRTDIFDLGRLNLHSGEARRLQLEVGFDPLELAGQEYAVSGGRQPVTLDVSHTTSGWSLRLRYKASLEGPCMRCLDPAERVIEIDAREVDQPGGGEDLTSPYVEGQDLDLRDWARDALMLDIFGQVLCKEDCAGLCAICGENLNDHPHEHEQRVDPRWARLSELKLK